MHRHIYRWLVFTARHLTCCPLARRNRPPARALGAVDEARSGITQVNRARAGSMNRAVAFPLLLWIAAGLVRADERSRSLVPLPDSQWDRSKAAHLLRRAGFGGTPEEVERLFALGVNGAVDRLVDYQTIPYEPAPPPVDPLLLEPLERLELRAMTPEQREQYLEQRRRAERRTFEQVRLWWIERMVESPRPLEEKMTLFWHGHFTSGMREVRNALFMKEQNEFLRRRALDNFREPLRGISRDRAMLVYLDGRNNVKARPNENFGRELLELFTLGVGNYTEADVMAAARAFTGWTFNQDGFIFRRRQHDDGVKTFLGRTGRWDGDDIIDIILEQPACARFLARKLLEFFCRPDPPRILVERLAREIRVEKYELKPVMKTLLRSQAFYHPDSRGCLVKSPVEIVVGTLRSLGQPAADLPAAARAMAAMGQELMQPPNVKGWDGGTAWINPATVFLRYNTVGAIIHGTGGRQRKSAAAPAGNDEEPAAGDRSAPGGGGGMTTAAGREPRSRLEGRLQPAFDALAPLRSAGVSSAAEIVDFYAAHLLAGPLAPAKRERLIEYLTGPDGHFSLDEERAGERVRTMVHLLCSTPEFQMF